MGKTAIIDIIENNELLERFAGLNSVILVN